MQQSQVNSEYLIQFAKLNELLRFYSMAKKLQKFSLIKDKTKLKISHIQKLLESYPQYQQIQQTVNKKIQSVFQELPPPAAKPAAQANNKSFAQAPSQNGKKSSNVNSSVNQSMNVGSSSRMQAQKTPKASQMSPKKTTSVILAPEKAKSTISETPKVSPPPLSSQKSIPEKVITPKPIKQPEPVVQVQKVQQKKVVQQSSILQFIPGQEIIKPQQKNLNEYSSLNLGKPAPVMNREQQKKMQLMKAMEVESISSIQNDNQQKPKSQSNSLMFMLEQQAMDKPLFEKKNSESFNRDQDSSYQFQQKGSQGSVYDDVIDLVFKFLSENKERLNQVLIFNNELFDQMQSELDGLIYLFGINKPQTKKIKQLYACTIMKFSMTEINRSEDKYEKEMKDFNNNIRIPLGVILKGQGVSAITPEHIKFLINLQSPYPVVLALKDNTANEGVLCQFQASVIERIRITPRKQLSQCADEIKKKTFTLPYRQEHFPKDKNKVTTKFLPRVIPNLAEQAPNAIAISGNQCIRQEKHSFMYKLHTKFLINSKSDFNIYYVNNNLVNARMSFKDKEYELFKKEVMEGQSKIATILSINVAKESSPIRKQFFQLLCESKDKRDPFIFINFSSLTVKKTVIAILRAQVTLEMVRSSDPLEYKSFEKDTQFTICLHVITKTNIKQFQQTEGKSEMVEIKPTK